MKVFTVATHSQNMFPFLQRSAKRFGHNLHVLGWGETYRNHLQKDELMLEAVTSLPDDEIVCFVDGFDSILCSTPEELLHAYRASGNTFIMSVDGRRSKLQWLRYPLWCYSYLRVFPRIHGGVFINTGMYMGTAREIKDWLTRVQHFTQDTNSNQVAWGRCINANPVHAPAVDEYSRLFYNHMQLFSDDLAIMGRPDGRVVVALRRRRVTRAVKD